LQYIYQGTSQSYFSISSFGPFKTALGDSAITIIFSLCISAFNQKKFNAEAGVRYNHHNIYGSNVTYSFNPSYNIDENTRVFVNISSAYKVPSLYQLYSEYANKKFEA
jgi:vitamin B12 transporter